MKAYFDRTAPFYLKESPSFDGVPVTVDPNTFEQIIHMGILMDTMAHRVSQVSNNEANSQELADFFVDEVKTIFNLHPSKSTAKRLKAQREKTIGN